MHLLNFIALLSLIALLTPSAMAGPKVGRAAAAKYLQARDPNAVEETPELAVDRSRFFAPEDHYLALTTSLYLNSEAYEWGQSGKEESVGKGGAAVSYRVGEWKYSMDMIIRFDYNEFQTASGRATKMSFLPVVTFPEASSKFPLYFGAGIGPGIFFKQNPGKSSISLDYQLVAGARFFNIFENTGFVIESGIKNHLNLLSSGQLNGTYIALGLVFTF